MSQILVSTAAHVAHFTVAVTVTVASVAAPQIRRLCPRCRKSQLFASSGKFRVNANGKTLDCWLIYRCTLCDERWNYPIHERQPVKALDARELDALMQNDPAWAERHARDVARLRRLGVEIVPSPAIVVSCSGLSGIGSGLVEIALVIEPGSEIRLDKLLAAVLRLQRAEIAALLVSGAMRIAPDNARAWKRRAVSGQCITLDLRHLPQALARLSEAFSEELITPGTIDKT